MTKVGCTLGFQVEVQRGYDAFVLPSAHAVLVASKCSDPKIIT